MSKFQEIMARANTASQNAKAQTLKDFPGDTDKAGRNGEAAKAAYLESSLQRYIENAERTRESQQPQCTPGWELLETWLGPKGSGKKVWVEYRTFTEEGQLYAHLYHCHIPGPKGCTKLLAADSTPELPFPFSTEQIAAWEAQAVAADSDDEQDAHGAHPTGCDYATELAADAYQRTLDVQHHANRRAA